MSPPTGTLARRDGRTREARLLRAIRAELTVHLGGAPSATQAALIEQAAQLKLRIAKMDEKFAETGEMSEHASRTYLAWANSFSRVVARLGLEAPTERPLTADEALARIHARYGQPAPIAEAERERVSA